MDLTDNKRWPRPLRQTGLRSMPPGRLPMNFEPCLNGRPLHGYWRPETISCHSRPHPGSPFEGEHVQPETALTDEQRERQTTAPDSGAVSGHPYPSAVLGTTNA
jgi:hypothetical protein